MFDPTMMPVMPGQMPGSFVAGPGQGQFVTMPPQQFAPQPFAPQQFAPQPFAPQQYTQQPPQRQPAPTRTVTPTATAQAGNRQPTKVLGKVDDEAPRPLSLPTPEQLGVAPPSPQRMGVAAPQSGGGPPGLDWTAARRRMQQAGVLSFQLEQLSSGGYRFVCVLAGVQPGRTQRIEAEGASEADAVRNVLQRLGGGN